MLEPIAAYWGRGGESFNLNCLECDANIVVPDDALDGEIVICPECGVSYELFRSNNGGFALRPAQVEGEDWGE